MKDKVDEKYAKFLETFKNVMVNIPLLDALEEMPSYGKFMKELLTKKRKVDECEVVSLSKECSAIVQRSLPPKAKDPGSFTLICELSNKEKRKALCDLGASINLMPLSIFERLKIVEIKPTGMTLQLADRSVTYPTGIVEDVLVKIDKFVFPVDFVIDVKVPLILGRPFLATTRVIVDVSSGKLTLKLGEEELTFDTRKAMKHPKEEEECHVIDLVDICVEETLQNPFNSSCFHIYDNPLFDCNSSNCDDRYGEKNHVEK
ncbi:hypothetical protein ACS0TY_032997 [Phlomoides rotata]